jgi:hypothetical protein
MKNLVKRISLWWEFEGRYYHKDFVSGVKNLIRWFPTIWKDRDWDDSFIFNLLIKKLEFQSKYIGDKDRHTRAKRDSEIMRTCVKLLKKVRDEDYGIEYMDYQKIEHEFVDSDKPGFLEVKTTELSENFDEFFKKYPKVYNKILKENPDSPKHRIAFLMGVENHKRAKRILFKLMENYIEYWWD